MNSLLRVVLGVVFLVNMPLFGEDPNKRVAILQAQVDVVPVVTSSKEPEKIVPGSTMKLKVRVSNTGKLASSPGTLYVRFALPPPLDTQRNSVLFETEKITIPAIFPGKTETFTFTTSHQWPTLYDFIRYDWGLRQYQAIVDIQDTEATIGTLAITFSAYYYQGPARQLAAEVPAQ